MPTELENNNNGTATEYKVMGYKVIEREKFSYPLYPSEHGEFSARGLNSTDSMKCVSSYSSNG